ncbi:MAG: hypothetical protein QM723_07045 [Myxococcaceae bacterium]
MLFVGLAALVAVGGGLAYWHSRGVVVPPPPPAPVVQQQTGSTATSTPAQQKTPAAGAGSAQPGGGLGGGALAVFTKVGELGAGFVASTLSGTQTRWTQQHATEVGAGIGVAAFLISYAAGISLLGLAGLAVATAVVAISEAATGYISIVDNAMTSADDKKRAATVTAAKDGNDYGGAWTQCEDWARARSEGVRKDNSVSGASTKAFWNSALATAADKTHSSYSPQSVTFNVGGKSQELPVTPLLDAAYSVGADSDAAAFVSGAQSLSTNDLGQLAHLGTVGGDMSTMMQKAIAAKNVAAVAQYWGDYWAFACAQQVPWLAFWPRNANEAAVKVLSVRLFDNPYQRNLLGNLDGWYWWETAGERNARHAATQQETQQERAESASDMRQVGGTSTPTATSNPAAGPPPSRSSGTTSSSTSTATATTAQEQTRGGGGVGGTSAKQGRDY